jgi:hypothetical protein
MDWSIVGRNNQSAKAVTDAIDEQIQLLKVQQTRTKTAKQEEIRVFNKVERNRPILNNRGTVQSWNGAIVERCNRGTVQSSNGAIVERCTR